MASAQVLPNPGAVSARKQGHLEAGKRRLEEFRKKKAEGRTKKAASTGQLPSADTDLTDKLSHENINCGYRSDRNCSDMEPWRITSQGDKTNNTSRINNIDSLSAANVSVGRSTEQSGSSVLTGGKDEDYAFYGSSGISDLPDGSNDQSWGKEPKNVHTDHGYNQVHRDSMLSDENTKAQNHSFVEAPLVNYRSPEKHTESTKLSPTAVSMASPGNSVDVFRIPTSGVATTSSSYTTFDVNKGIMDQSRHVGFSLSGKISESISRHLNVDSPASYTSGYSSTNCTSKRPSDQYSFPSFHGNASGRSRPSFFDSINISRASLISDISAAPSDLLRADPPSVSNSANNADSDLTPSPQQPFVKIDASQLSGLSYDDTNERMEPSLKKDDNFATLEQHIEDLTQEKFSLQRALETSKSLAESLASENSSLTESFNQQGKVVNQVKSDMEQLKEEIKAQLLAFESLKEEYANSQLECNAADERAKILASEVINLEEKTLRLRSNELKLEKQLENLNGEIDSYRRKLSSLEKERNDFQSTIEAFQEEKKLLQSKLWKTSFNEKAIDKSSLSIKKDACTSTSDLDFEREMNSAETTLPRNLSEDPGSVSSVRSGDTTSSSFVDDGRKILLPDTFFTIPHDQMKMIGNINSLISELALEKEGLKQALVAESSLNSKLKDLSKELSQKLEAQTQRFELLAAQRMANDNMHAVCINTENMHAAIEYADEGDEVVERVLGWIMKLFPGGPTKRRTSKLL